MTPIQSKTGQGPGPAIARLLVATLVPVFGLFVLRVILAALPMIRNAGPIGDLGVTPMLLIKATLDTVIYFLIIRFCLAASHEIRAVRPHLSEIANVVVLAGCALVSTLAYSGYQDVFAAVAPAQSELYNWLFLVIVLAPIAMIVVIVARRLDFFTNLMFGKLNAVAIQQTAFAAAPQPPPGPAPDLDTSREIRDRVSSIERKVESAKAEAEKLRARNALGTETADSVAKMQGYRDGALAAIEKEDWAGARHFSDWAEYEASRVLADAINGDARLP